jgi:hypothetical protein
VNVERERPMTEEILETLFPGNPLLCFGRTPYSFSTRPREYWSGRESDFQFIVPNPMIKKSGVGKDGKESKRCLANTGPRRFLVTEFDISEKSEEWGPYVRDWKAKGISVLDANVALILELARRGLPRLPLGRQRTAERSRGFFVSDRIRQKPLPGWGDFSRSPIRTPT